MNRPSPTRIRGLILVIGLVGLARPAAADQRPSLRIVLHVSDHHSTPLDVVSRAKTKMTRIYRDAGIKVM